jgi:hypothetical protein
LPFAHIRNIDIDTGLKSREINQLMWNYMIMNQSDFIDACELARTGNDWDNTLSDNSKSKSHRTKEAPSNDLPDFFQGGLK